MAKIASAVDSGDVPAAARLADEDPGQQGSAVAQLSDAAGRGKSVGFDYTNSHGVSAPHRVEPYGLFLHDGRWYLVGRDVEKDEPRTYTVARMSDIEVNRSRPKSPDFERPADFDVASFVRLPFQYGPAESEFEALVRFDATGAVASSFSFGWSRRARDRWRRSAVARCRRGRNRSCSGS